MCKSLSSKYQTSDSVTKNKISFTVIEVGVFKGSSRSTAKENPGTFPPKPPYRTKKRKLAVSISYSFMYQAAASFVTWIFIAHFLLQKIIVLVVYVSFPAPDQRHLNEMDDTY